jgi:8-oxo-dGTP pyrophosphatase MutT (NUDIX family)
MTTQDAVLLFVVNKDEVLLAESNYREGKTTWNGISGYLENKEKPEEAAIRVLYNEVKLRIYEHDLEQVGIMHLYTLYPNNSHKKALRITIFLCERFQGEARMTPGVRPRWFNFANIPFGDMFEDTKEWLERILAGEKLIIEVISKIDEHSNQLSVTDVSVRNIFEK